MERTLCLIKPDAVKNLKTWEILGRLDFSFNVIAIKKHQFSREEVKKFYAEHIGKDYYPGVEDFMVSGPIYAIILEGTNVINRYRDMLGYYDPPKAHLNSLRRIYGSVSPANAVHGSDSEESARREISFFFPNFK